jgi:CRISPR-associated protein Csm4
MPDLESVHLTFRSGLHVGRHGIGQEAVMPHVPADTLFSALAATRALLIPDTGTWAGRFKTDPPPFRLTSAFPLAGGVRFYPRPLAAPPGLTMEPKRWRNVRFVSETIMRHLQSGRLPPEYELPARPDEEPRQGLGLQDGALWLARKEVGQLPEPIRTWRERKGATRPRPLEALLRQRVWAEATVPRVTVERISNRSQIFHTGRVSFAPGCGLWFGVQWFDETARPELLAILAALGDAGLGAERSAGYGAFTFATGERLGWPDPTADGVMLMLSRCYPARGDMAAVLDSRATYNLVYVAGHLQSLGRADQRRRGVYLITEGSIIGGAARGRLAKVTPTAGSYPHEVWRYGLALGIEVQR